MKRKAFKNRSKSRKIRNLEHQEYAAEMSEYRSIARYITQIAISALVLPIFFVKNFAPVKEGEPIFSALNVAIFVSWGLLLFSSGAGIWYQYIATKKIIHGREGGPNRYPRTFFTITMFCFYAGILAFLIGVILLNRK